MRICYTIKKLLLILITGVTFVPFIHPYDLLIIDSQNSYPYVPVRESMVKELKKKGFIEGENLNITIWSLANEEGMARRAWMTEKENDFDLIFLNGTIAVKSFSGFVPGTRWGGFLFGAVTDPVGLGVIENFTDRPCSVFTGVAYPVKVEERLRFIMAIFPEARDIGFIYADMPQSISYRSWLDEALAKEEFSHLKFHFRVVQFVQGESGHIRMAMLSEKHIRELSPQVDLFLSPNDQMGVQPDYARTIHRLSDKPLVGLGDTDVMDEWGAVASIFPDLEEMGVQLAEMAEKLLGGSRIEEILPQWSRPGMAFNLKEAERLGITIPDKYLKMAKERIVRPEPPD